MSLRAHEAVNDVGGWAVTPYTGESLGKVLNDMGQVTFAASSTWSANLVMAYPFEIAAPRLVSQMFWCNGVTIGGNTDVGIYSEDGATVLAHSGATANSGSAAFQLVDITDVLLAGPGRYWLAIGSDSGTHQYYGDAITIRYADTAGVKGQTGAYSSGLPSSLTLNVAPGGIIPICGFVSAAVL